MEPAGIAGSTSKRLVKVASKRGRALPRRAQDLSKEELLLTLQKKRECNAIALKIVERMLEPNVQEDWFLNVLKDINQSHLQDVSEERAIIKLCGYPLCSHELKHIPAQQFRISTKLNKVYDIQERKNFCSNRCFKSCKFVKDQMHSSPLWLRDIEPIVNFTLLPVTDPRCGIGDEVNVQIERVSKEEMGELSMDDSLSPKAKKMQGMSTEKEKTLSDLLHNLKLVESMRKDIESDDTEIVPEPNNSMKEGIVAEEGTSVSYIKPEKQILEDSEGLCQEKISKCGEIDNLQSPGVNPEVSIKQVKTETKLIKNSSEADLLSRQSNATCNTKSNELEPATETSLQDNEAVKLRSSVSFSCNASGRKLVSEHPQNLNCSARTSSGGIPEKLNSSKGCSNASNNSSIACSKSTHKIKGLQSSKKAQLSCHVRVQGPVALVENCLQDWFTMETMCFLFGEQVLKEMLEQKGESIQAHYKALSSITWDQEKHERFLSICKRLSLIEMEDSIYDNQAVKDAAETPLKPLPDYNALKKESETMDLKVKAFYRGKMEMIDKKVSFTADVKSESLDAPNGVELQLPLVHLHSQRALRKKIVLDGLNRVLPDLLRTFGMRPSELSSSIRGLIGTFALSPTNITFKPQEWNLLGLVVIKILSLREPGLKQCLQLEQTTTYITLMLMSYNQEPGYLDHFLSWLTDVDRLLKRFASSET